MLRDEDGFRGVGQEGSSEGLCVLRVTFDSEDDSEDDEDDDDGHDDDDDGHDDGDDHDDG